MFNYAVEIYSVINNPGDYMPMAKARAKKLQWCELTNIKDFYPSDYGSIRKARAAAFDFAKGLSRSQARIFVVHYGQSKTHKMEEVK